MARKQPSEKEKKSFQIKAGILIFVAFVFASVSFYSYQILFADNILVDKQSKILYIPKGATFEEVVIRLERDTFLHDRLSFMFLSKLLKYRDNVKPGRYEVEPNTSNFRFIKTLINGRQTPLKLTFNNIRTKKDLVRKFTRRLALDSISLDDTLNNSSYLNNYGFNDTTIVAMFIPNTYEVYWTWSCTEILDFFQKEYQKFWTAERQKKAKEIGLTPIEVIVMASIIEAETQNNEEKPRIAGVYMNRYNAGQRLQADPTLIFATEDFNAKRVNEFHRYFPSPYNTYRKKGLPPGPINLPSIASIDAILNYEKHAYYFFCAEPNLSGKHLFSKTFEEHLNIAKNYWSSLDKEGIH
jgi:UPF0755 protein